MSKEDEGKEGHEENVQQNEEDVLGEMARLLGRKVSDRFGGGKEPGRKTVFDGLGRDDVGLNALEQGESPDLFYQLLQLSITDIAISPLGEFNDLGGHIDQDEDKWRYDDEENRDRHQQRDRIVPLRERFPEPRVDRIECKGEDRRPKNSREERREDMKNFVDDKGQDGDKEKRDELFAFHGISLADFPILTSKTLTS